MKCLMFLFPRSGNEAKRGVELRQSTRNARRIWRKVGNGILTLGSQVPSAYPAMCKIKREAKKNFILYGVNLLCNLTN